MERSAAVEWFGNNQVLTMTVSRVTSLLKKSVTQFSEDNATRIGAALAYYSLFAMAPLFIVLIAVVSVVFGERAAQGQVVAQLKDHVGTQGAATIEQIINRTREAHSGTTATIVGLIFALVGATGFFVEMQGALDTIWKVKPKPGRAWLTIIRDRALSFILVLFIGLLLISSVVLTTILSGISAYVPADMVPGQFHIWRLLNVVISFAFMTLLFAVIYKFLPDAQIAWQHVWFGAAVTSLLFALGKYLIGLYLTHSGMGSAYGAAGSLVLVIAWVYYSSLIFLYGAEFTRAHAELAGEHIKPTKNAELVKCIE